MNEVVSHLLAAKDMAEDMLKALRPWMGEGLKVALQAFLDAPPSPASARILNDALHGIEQDDAPILSALLEDL